VLLLRAVDPRQPVEKQRIVVARRQSLQLVAGTMQQHCAQPANLGPDPRCSHCLNGHAREITDCRNPPGEPCCQTSLGR
jgi:hypothetical protein